MNKCVSVKQRRQCFNMLQQQEAFNVQSPKDPLCVLHLCSTAFILLLSGVKIGQRWKLMNQPPKRSAIIIWTPFPSLSPFAEAHPACQAV